MDPHRAVGVRRNEAIFNIKRFITPERGLDSLSHPFSVLGVNMSIQLVQVFHLDTDRRAKQIEQFLVVAQPSRLDVQRPHAHSGHPLHPQQIPFTGRQLFSHSVMLGHVHQFRDDVPHLSRFAQHRRRSQLCENRSPRFPSEPSSSHSHRPLADGSEPPQEGGLVDIHGDVQHGAPQHFILLIPHQGRERLVDFKKVAGRINQRQGVHGVVENRPDALLLLF